MLRLAHAGRARAALVLCSLTAAVLVVACSDSTAPKSHGLTPAQAYASLDSADQDSARDLAGYGIPEVGMMLAAYGAPVGQMTATVNGQAETFNVVAGNIVRDTAGVIQDSIAIVFGWRGREAQEILMALLFHDRSKAGDGLQAGNLTYVDGSTKFASANNSLPGSASATAAGGACAMFAPPDTSDYTTHVYQSKTLSCQAARVAASVAGPVRNYDDTTDVRTVSVSLPQLDGVRAHIALR